MKHILAVLAIILVPAFTMAEQSPVSGGEVRLRNAYVIKADKVIKDDSGEIVELHCSYDPNTLGKNPEGRKVRGVIHWVSAEKCHAAEIRLYDPLFTVDFPDATDRDYHELINPDSLTIKHGFVEESLASAEIELVRTR